MPVSMGKARTSDFTLIPAGTYRVKIAGVDESEPHPEYGPGLEWSFDLVDPEDSELAETLKDAGEKFTQLTGLIAGPKSKARRWVESLIGRELEEDEEVTDQLVVGRIADALVVNRPNQKGVTRHYVETLIPVKKKKATPTAPPPDEDDEEAPF